MILILLTATAALFFYYNFVKPLNYWKERGVKQGNPMWVFGDNWYTFFRIRSFAEVLITRYNQTPDTRYFGLYAFVKPTLMLKDLDLIKHVTVKDFDHFTDHRTFIPEDADPLWNKNLFALKGDPWRDMRSILSPSFTSSKMRSMFVLVSECANNFVQNFRKQGEETISLDAKDVFSRFTNDVIATTAFGVKVDSVAEPNNEFYVKGREATDFTKFGRILKMMGFILFPIFFKRINIKIFNDDIGQYFRQLIDHTIKNRTKNGIVRPDMIHLLMEARKGGHKQEENNINDTGFATAKESNLGKSKTTRDLSNEDITAQALVFFFAGFDTVSNALSFAIYELAVNQDIQDKLREEIRSTLEESGGKLTYENLLKMKYMDMVISETLRKWPNLAATDRVCTKPYTIPPVTPEEKPIYLEKGALISIPIYAIHHNPEYYTNPARFDPERFNDENKGNIKPYTYMPFGVGPRNCIGSRFALMEIKTVLFYLLENFELVPTKRTEIPLKISKKSFTVSAQNGFWIGMKRIK